MDEQRMNAIMCSVVALTCKELTKEELAVLNLIAITDGDPHGRLFDYKKVKRLFTESNGTRMHAVTKEALAAIVSERL